MRICSWQWGVVVVACVAADARSHAADDAFAEVRRREAELHAACDKWEAVAAAGGDTAVVSRELESAYIGLAFACKDATLQGNNAWLLPDQVAWAGKLSLPDETEVSCMIGKGQSGLIMSLWHRTAWEDRLPAHGIRAGVGIAPYELLDDFKVAPAKWEGEGRAVLQVPYSLRNANGVIEVRCDGEEWTIRPDRGKCDDKWWHPFEAK